MKALLVRIGNSQGIRIPASVIKQCGFEKHLEINVKNKTMIVSASDGTRYGWKEISIIENQNNAFDEKGEWEW